MWLEGKASVAADQEFATFLVLYQSTSTSQTLIPPAQQQQQQQQRA
jgi:hypothetical protein